MDEDRRRELGRERQRRWRAANPERVRENARRQRAANAERIREQKRAYRARNPEKLRAYERRYRDSHVEEERERMRQYREANRGTIRAKWAAKAHGPDIGEVVATMWQEQAGKCYLCASPLDGLRVCIDHDHACCAAGSCAYCRRGLACDRCNKLIGHAQDDPDLLRLIAQNLELAMNDSRSRISRKPVQETIT